MSVEQGGIQPRENLVAQEESLRVAPVTTAQELLARNYEESGNLSLGTDPLHIIAAQIPHSDSTEYLALFLTPLESHSFNQLLYEDSPNPRFGLDKYGVLDDWKMPDRDGQRLRYYKDLQDKHARLGKHWKEFERHRRLFLQVLEFDPSSLERMFDFESYEDVLNKAPQRFRQSLARVPISEDERAVRMQFIAFLKSHHQLTQRKWIHEASDEEILKRFQGWLNDNRLVRSFWKTLSSQERRHLLNTYSISPEATYIPDSTPPGFIYKNNTFEDVHMQPIGEGKVLIQAGNFLKAETVLKKDEYGRLLGWRFIPESVQTTNCVIPAIRWEKDSTGKRRFNFDSLDESFLAHSMSLMGEVPEGLTFDAQRFNTLVGLLAVAYLVPELRKRWPKDQSLVKEGRTNFMGPAQVPVLALQRSGQILRSEFFDRAEAYLESTAV